MKACPRCKSEAPLIPHRAHEDAFAPDWCYSCATTGCRETFDALVELHPDELIARGYRVEWFGEDA